jgi:hypothetical protein
VFSSVFVASNTKIKITAEASAEYLKVRVIIESMKRLPNFSAANTSEKSAAAAIAEPTTMSSGECCPVRTRLPSVT